MKGSETSGKELQRVLIVDDEASIRSMVAFNLRQAGYEVIEAEDGSAARRQLADWRPALVLMDWMLPDISGLELTRAIKRDADQKDLPIIMLTAKAAEHDKISGLDSGADDYVTKPFSPRELVARVKAVLRRAGAEPGERIEHGELGIETASHRVTAKGEEISLGPTEYRMLKFFAEHPDRVFSRSQLLDRIWGANVYIEERTVDVHVRRLRKSLAPSGCDRYIQTVRGAGYRFSPRRSDSK